MNNKSKTLTETKQWQQKNKTNLSDVSDASCIICSKSLFSTQEPKNKAMRPEERPAEKKVKIAWRTPSTPTSTVLLVFLNWHASALSKTLPGKQEWEAFQAKNLSAMYYRFIDFPFKRLTRDDELSEKDWLEMTSSQKKID